MIQATEMVGRLLRNELLSAYTTWGVGGVADQLYLPVTINDLARFMRALHPREPLLWIGRGSNLLVRSGGVRGTVVALTTGVGGIEQLTGGAVRAEAGASLSLLASFFRRTGAVGLDFLAGIPGSVGGGLAMNAGAFGGEIWDLVTEVEVMNRRGDIIHRSVDEYQIGYRSVRRRQAEGGDEWFVAATFNGRGGEAAAGSGAGRLQQLQQRNSSQPMALHSCGSVFRNPDGDFAGRLIEESGLKGYCIGAACVSGKHANFITHGGDATAAEIEALIDHVANAVEESHGVRLQREVRIVGEAVREDG